MTWTIKRRGSSDRPVVAEYICPVHGRFACEVKRDENGDPPEAVECGSHTGNIVRVSGMSHGGSGPDHGADMPCPRICLHAISAPARCKVKLVEAAVRGKHDAQERETWTNTNNLADGQSLEDWREDRASVWRRHDERAAYEIAKEM